MNCLLGFVIQIAVGTLVSSQLTFPEDDNYNCLEPNAFCTDVSKCSFVPPQFLRQMTTCATRNEVCCTKLLTPPFCSKEVKPVNIDIRIYKGESTELGDWPWMAVLGYKKKVKGAEFTEFCGGSLINHLFVLTAAHCRPNIRQEVQFLVRLGDHDLKVTTDAQHIERKEVKFIKHPGFRLKPNRNDIALVKMDSSVRFNANIKPICLPISDELRRMSYDWMTAQLAGWGLTESGVVSPQLLETTLIINNSTVCTQELKERNTVFSPSIQLCTVQQNGESSCEGDSGGPLMVEVEGIHYAIGVVSTGKCGQISVYTKVTEFISWIRDTVKENI